jgi:hypothetical protein
VCCFESIRKSNADNFPMWRPHKSEKPFVELCIDWPLSDIQSDRFREWEARSINNYVAIFSIIHHSNMCHNKKMWQSWKGNLLRVISCGDWEQKKYYRLKLTPNIFICIICRVFLSQCDFFCEIISQLRRQRTSLSVYSE